MIQKIREWLIFKLIGDQPAIVNINFADVVIRPGEHIIQKPIVLFNSNCKIRT